MEEETRRGEALISSPAQPTRSTHSPSHHASAPARRNRRRAWLRQRQPLRTSHLLLVVFLTCCLSLTAASSSVYIAESMVEVEESPMSETFQESLARLARTGTILVDPRPPPNVEPNPHAWTLATLDDDLAAAQRRSLDRPNQNSHDRLNARQVGDEHADADAKSSSSSMISTATRPSPTKSSETASGTSGIVAQTSTASSTLPTPFDTGFGGNITQSCSDFMSGFLGNATFKECLPFSLLLQGSTSFFEASKSITLMTQTLDKTCAANASQCAPLMTALAANLTSATNCASDFTNQNPLIQQAHTGLLAYTPLYTASCLRNPATQAYCFADAVTNASSPTDSYVYYLPLNISLPGGSQPTCDACLQNTMQVFESASADRRSALASDYVVAAQQINVQCGPGFVGQTLAPAVSGGVLGSRAVPPGGLGGVVALGVVLLGWLL